jgi:hypothetical protein
MDKRACPLTFRSGESESSSPTRSVVICTVPGLAGEPPVPGAPVGRETGRSGGLLRVRRTVRGVR